MPDLRLLFTVLALVAAMTFSGVLGWRSRVGAVLLGLLSFVWLTVDKLWEGPHLLALGRGHAVVTADLVGFVGAAVAVGLWLHAPRQLRADLVRMLGPE